MASSPPKSGTTPNKSLRSRMGGAIRRASTGFAFQRPGTPGSRRSSSESLRVDAQSLAPSSLQEDHKLPSPVPESPAREAREVETSEHEHVGPSPLAAPPVTSSEPSQPIDIPAKPATEVHARTWESNAPIAQTPDQMSGHEVDTTDHPTRPEHPEYAGSTDQSSESNEGHKAHSDAPAPTEVHAAPWGQTRESSISASDAVPEAKADAQSQKAPSVHQEPVPAPPATTAQAPAAPQAPVAPQPAAAREAPVQREQSMLANPWASSDTGHEPTQERSAPPTHVDMPPPGPVQPVAVGTPAEGFSTDSTPRPIDYARFESPLVRRMSGAATGRARSSTVSSLARPVSPPPNGRLSAKPSKSSLAPSVGGVKADQSRHVVIVDEAKTTTIPGALEPDTPAEYTPPSQVGPSAEDSDMHMPEPSPASPAAAPSRSQQAVPIALPLPPAEEVIYARPINNMPSQYSLGGQSTVAPASELGEYETDETRPLLGDRGARNAEAGAKSLQPEPQPVVYFRPSDSTIWPVPTNNFEALGWREHILPNGVLYFSNSSLRVTTDIDLRISGKLDAVASYLSKRDGEEIVPPPEGWELWLRDGGASRNEFIPARAWVDHVTRMLSFKQPPVRSGECLFAEDEKLGAESRYWSFMESHPAHAPLPPSTVAEAMDILTWSYTERLLPSAAGAPPAFTHEECQQLMGLLRSVDAPANHAPSTAATRTRIVAKVFYRITTWRQGYTDVSQTQPSGRNGDHNEPRIPFRRKVTDFIISAICLGIPYLFLERSHHQRLDAESGLRSSAGPMLVIGACACLIAAVVLSASVTFISLPGLDDVSRVAGFVAILLSASSMVSAIIALFRYKADIERSSYVGGEGLITISRRSVLLSLPLVFLIWSIIAFITGITLYAFRGVSITGIGAITRQFKDYTRWTVVGAIGGLAGMLFMSALLVRW
ncbi:hypothetical protein DENSPDRAFT_831596 [Dentipellis sp. KUC8613]|nr:hypothetical protein DENSPDRAFT_831596 [Dentipellis sp. KUC8613]